MIVQLPNGRIIECSLEQYLSLTDQEVQDLNGLSSAYTKEVGNPFYNSFSSTTSNSLDANMSLVITNLVSNSPSCRMPFVQCRRLRT